MLSTLRTFTLPKLWRGGPGREASGVMTNSNQLVGPYDLIRCTFWRVLASFGMANGLQITPTLLDRHGAECCHNLKCSFSPQLTAALQLYTLPCGWPCGWGKFISQYARLLHLQLIQLALSQVHDKQTDVCIAHGNSVAPPSFSHSLNAAVRQRPVSARL